MRHSTTLLFGQSSPYPIFYTSLQAASPSTFPAISSGNITALIVHVTQARIISQNIVPGMRQPSCEIYYCQCSICNVVFILRASLGHNYNSNAGARDVIGRMCKKACRVLMTTSCTRECEFIKGRCGPLLGYRRAGSFRKHTQTQHKRQSQRGAAFKRAPFLRIFAEQPVHCCFSALSSFCIY